MLNAASVPDVLHVVEIQLAKSDQDVVEEMVAALDLDLVAVASRPDDDFAVLRLFAESPAAALALQQQLTAAAASWQELLSGPPWIITQTQVQRENWAESWKQYFHTEKISARIVIKPSWETYVAAAGEVVVEIDPGMSFGTGQHGTTRACLAFLDTLQARLGGVSFLDAGCGSGILAMAAWLLGHTPVYAFDYDPDAVAIARMNLARIGAGAVPVDVADLADFTPPQRCKIVAANILAPVLQQHMARLLGFVEPGGYLLLSGILTEQYEPIRQQVIGLGGCEEETVTLQEWTSGCFRCR